MQPELLDLTGTKSATQRPEITGVRGWLLLFCIMVTIYAPARTAAEVIFGPWGYSSVIVLCLAALAFFTGISLWQVNSRALLLTKVLLIVLFCLGTLGLVVDVVNGTRLDRGSDLEFMTEAAIWYWYFKKSKRVRATFGRSI
jgi:hypothetical protein